MDWPTARFFRELHAAYPDAKFILSTRSPRSWAESFGETINMVIAEAEKAPPHLREWIAMAKEVIEQSGIPVGADTDALEKAFIAHEKAVKAAIPAGQLLVFEAKQGWAPLCAFLGVPARGGAFPRTNNRGEFWDLIKSVS